MFKECSKHGPHKAQVGLWFESGGFDCISDEIQYPNTQPKLLRLN